METDELTGMPDPAGPILIGLRESWPLALEQTAV
jgi:hypothetical protein